jgi:hypothetical protein
MIKNATMLLGMGVFLWVAGTSIQDQLDLA